MEMGRSYQYPTRLPFVVDENTMVSNDGRQVDWDQVPESYRSSKQTVQLSAAAAAGAVALAVDALPVKVMAGTMLNFGTYAPVTVTASGTNAANATTLNVTALSGPIPSGTVLVFSGVKQYAQLTAAAIAGATALTVAALPTAISASETALFPGGTLQARVTANAAAAATALVVDELQFGIPDDSQATIAGTGAKTIKAGTVMCELAAAPGKVVPRAARPGSETASSIQKTDAVDGDLVASLSGYGQFIGGPVYENMLPEAVAGVIPSAFKTELNAVGVGTGFSWQVYGDSR